jgi:N-acetyl-gamma-glutamyl-phosphate reductase
VRETVRGASTQRTPDRPTLDALQSSRDPAIGASELRSRAGLLESQAMSKPHVFIDGHAGTTGLRIREWLANRADLVLSTLEESERKSEPARRKAIAESDLTVLCLPDEAAMAAAVWAEESGARVLDASSVHRVAEGWVYGMPELAPDQRREIRAAQKVTNPGCYPSAFNLLVRPLVDAEIVPRTAALSIHALSGYSGGGRALIERWETDPRDLLQQPFESPYALERIHKHVPEMHRYTGLVHAPQFVPAVGPFACGMRVQVPLHGAALAEGASAEAIWETLRDRYRGEPFVEVAAYPGSEPVSEESLDPTALNDTNRIRLHVYPNAQGHVLLVGILDNLGKGASGVAIQNLNLMLDLGEETGLPR